MLNCSGKRIWVGILLIILSGSLSLAQPKIMDACVNQMMDEYSHYINDNVHALWIYHGLLETFNFEMNAYYEATTEEKRTLRLRFLSKPVLNNPEHFPALLPVTRYQTLQSQHGCIPQPYRDALAGYLKQLQEVVDEIQVLSDQLARYTQSKAYMEEPDLATGYKHLSRCFVLYHDFSALKDAMFYELKKLYRHYELPDRKNPYMAVNHSLETLFVPIRGILRGLKEESQVTVKNNHARLQQALLRAEAGRYSLLNGFAGPDRAFVETMHGFILAVAGDIRAYASEYMASDAIPEKYKDHGKSYYYYNNRMLPIYNRHGEGLIRRFNEMVARADVNLLVRMEEPNWFKVVLPENWEEAPPEAPEPPVAVVEEPEPKPPATTPERPSRPAPTLEGAAPNNLVFLLDVSSSMEDPEKLPLLKDSFKYLLTLMRPEDRVAIVTYSGIAKVALASTTSKDKNRIISAIDNLQSAGKTDALKGVILAYRIAQQNFIENGNNRIILASDGYFKITDALPRLVEDRAEDNIQLSVFYFGELEERITSRLMRLADLGNGNYRHIRRGNANQTLIEEARAVGGGPDE